MVPSVAILAQGISAQSVVSRPLVDIFTGAQKAKRQLWVGYGWRRQGFWQWQLDEQGAERVVVQMVPWPRWVTPSQRWGPKVVQVLLDLKVLLVPLPKLGDTCETEHLDG